MKKKKKRIGTMLALVAAFQLFSFSAFAQQGAWVRVNQLVEAVSAPQIFTVTNGVATLLWPAGQTNDVRTDGKTMVRTIQNLGTNAVGVHLRATNELAAVASVVAATNFHYVLPPGTSLRDGRSAPLDLSWWRYSVYVSVLTNGSAALGSEVSAVEGTQ